MLKGYLKNILLIGKCAVCNEREETTCSDGIRALLNDTRWREKRPCARTARARTRWCEGEGGAKHV